jgi:succinate dehydrogenase/fumarate reductase-like Fe-S protein
VPDAAVVAVRGVAPATSDEPHATVAPGALARAADDFDACIDCDLCVAACREPLAPAHLGTHAHRVTTRVAPLPVDLVARLAEVAHGRWSIEFDILSEPDGATS